MITEKIYHKLTKKQLDISAEKLGIAEDELKAINFAVILVTVLTWIGLFLTYT